MSRRLIAALVVLVSALCGCGDEQAESASTGVNLNLSFGSIEVTSVAFYVACDSGVELNGEFNVHDDQDPPVWGAFMDLPVGDCSIAVTAEDGGAEPLCEGYSDFTVAEDETAKVSVVMTCASTPDDPSAP